MLELTFGNAVLQAKGLRDQRPKCRQTADQRCPVPESGHAWEGRGSSEDKGNCGTYDVGAAVGVDCEHKLAYLLLFACVDGRNATVQQHATGRVTTGMGG